MDVRETLNRHPKAALGGTLAALAIAVAGWAALSGGGIGARGTQSSPLDRAFYSIDDGATWFTDARNIAYPFNHKGKPAYRAYVFKCGETGAPFVAYLERLSAGDDARAGVPVTDAIEVKRAGDAEWVKPSSPKGVAVMTPKCPSDAAGGAPQPILP